MTAALAPTPELQRQRRMDAPLKDRETNRTAYRIVDAFETLHRAGHIDGEERQAAAKLEKHYLGSIGVDVRYGEGSGLADVEDPRTYHAQKLAKARAELSVSEWHVIESLMMDPAARMDDLGRLVSRYTDRAQAKAAATVLTQQGLERLCYLWGLKSHPPSPLNR